MIGTYLSQRKDNLVVMLRINLMLRVFDLMISFFGLLFLFPFLLVIFLRVFFDTGSPLFVQERVGCQKKTFRLVKFRTMSKGTASVSSHLVNSLSITKLGGFLRRTKLDELPQLWNVLLGDMSLVGPRPNLFNQVELIEKRHSLGIYNVRPGITGLAQVNKIDMSTPALLAKTDLEMINTLSVGNYFRYIIFTISGKGRGHRVKG